MVELGIGVEVDFGDEVFWLGIGSVEDVGSDHQRECDEHHALVGEDHIQVEGVVENTLVVDILHGMLVGEEVQKREFADSRVVVELQEVQISGPIEFLAFSVQCPACYCCSLCCFVDCNPGKYHHPIKYCNGQ